MKPFVQVLFLLGALLVAQVAHATDAMLRELSLVDETRAIKASPAAGFAGSATRRIDVKVWYPGDGKGGPWPLIVYSHGTYGSPDSNMHLVNALVADGYIVAAPSFPLTSRSAFTHIKAPDTSDTAEQVRDVSFVIDKLLADPVFGKLIDKDRIGTTGHSLGAITSYFLSFGKQMRDSRIKATAPIAAGNPVMAARMGGIGIGDTALAAVSVPVLLLSADKDVFARMTGGPLIAYSRLSPPRYELTVTRGNHVWFRDGDEQPADNKNPDCFFFEKWTPGMAVPGCEERVPLIGPARQQEITRAAILAFFDAYLKRDRKALARLRGLGGEFGDTRLVYVD